jgi:hypothetical protein
MIKNIVAKEAPDLRGIVLRLIVVMVLLFAIGIIVEGEPGKQAETSKHNFEKQYENKSFHDFANLEGV